MSFLLPQTRMGVLRTVRTVDLHGDRYLDLTVDLDDPPGSSATGRLGVGECPDALRAGEHVSVRFTMGQITRVERHRES